MACNRYRSSRRHGEPGPTGYSCTLHHILSYSTPFALHTLYYSIRLVYLRSLRGLYSLLASYSVLLYDPCPCLICYPLTTVLRIHLDGRGERAHRADCSRRRPGSQDVHRPARPGRQEWRGCHGGTSRGELVQYSLPGLIRTYRMFGREWAS